MDCVKTSILSPPRPSQANNFCSSVYRVLFSCFVLGALVGRRKRNRTTAGTGVWLAVAGRTVISTVGTSRISRFTWAEHEFTPETPRTDYVLGKWRTLCPTTNYWRTRH